jgi:hypothetical protein
MLYGFIDDNHRIAFEAARERVRRGGPEALCCGARLRSGGLCGHPPVSGSKRCRLHCGPVVSRQLRDIEIEQLARGELAHEDFAARDARRAANRTRDRWKRDPWQPGQTLDLGPHEECFVTAMIFAGHRPERLAPAVLDACRWKWRRFMVDRRNEAAWQAWCSSDLHVRIEGAGPATEGWVPGGVACMVPAFKVIGKPKMGSKRLASDRQRVVQPRAPKVDRRRVRALDAPAVAGELAEAALWFAENRNALNAWAAHIKDERSLLVLWRGAIAAQHGDYSVWETASGLLA